MQLEVEIRVRKHSLLIIPLATLRPTVKTSQGRNLKAKKKQKNRKLFQPTAIDFPAQSCRNPPNVTTNFLFKPSSLYNAIDTAPTKTTIIGTDSVDRRARARESTTCGVAQPRGRLTDCRRALKTKIVI